MNTSKTLGCWKTGIDLAGESKGVFFDKALVTDTDKWGTASLTSGSFGQTFKITPCSWCGRFRPWSTAGS